MLLGDPNQGTSGTAWQEEVPQARARAGGGAGVLTRPQAAPAPAGSVLGGERPWLPADVSLLRGVMGAAERWGCPLPIQLCLPFPTVQPGHPGPDVLAFLQGGCAVRLEVQRPWDRRDGDTQQSGRLAPGG